MKIRFLYVLVLFAFTSLVSCDKGKDDKPSEPPTAPTTVTIGGKEYPIVKIGTQSWMGSNYSGAGGSYFNENAPNAEYGKLYTYTEAMAITPPDGWHLATKANYVDLLQLQGAIFTGETSTSADAIKKVQSVAGWSAGHQGTNSSKFNAFPAGFFANGIFNAEGDVTIYWTSSKTADNKPVFFSISKGEVSFYNEAPTTQKFSVRFAKND